MTQSPVRRASKEPTLAVYTVQEGEGKDRQTGRQTSRYTYTYREGETEKETEKLHNFGQLRR